MAVALAPLWTSAEPSQTALHARQMTRWHFSHGKVLHVFMSVQALVGFSSHKGHMLNLKWYLNSS